MKKHVSAHCRPHVQKHVKRIESGGSSFDILDPASPYGLWIPYTGYSTTTLASGKVQEIADYAGSNRSLRELNTSFQPTWYASQNGWGIGSTVNGGGGLNVLNSTSVTSFTVAAKLYLHQNASNHHLLSNNNMDPLFLPTANAGEAAFEYYSFNFSDEPAGLGNWNTGSFPFSTVFVWRYNATTGVASGFNEDNVKTNYSGNTSVSSTFSYVGRLSGATGLVRVQALCAWSAAHDDSTCADIAGFLLGL